MGCWLPVGYTVSQLVAVVLVAVKFMTTEVALLGTLVPASCRFRLPPGPSGLPVRVSRTRVGASEL